MLQDSLSGTKEGNHANVELLIFVYRKIKKKKKEKRMKLKERDVTYASYGVTRDVIESETLT